MHEGEPIIGIRDFHSDGTILVRKPLELAGYRVVPDQKVEDSLSRNELNLLFLNVGLETPRPQKVVTDFRNLTGHIPIMVIGPTDAPSYIAPILDAGADDYLMRDGLDSRELLARVRAQLRRPRGESREEPPKIIKNGDLTIDLTDGREVMVGERVIALTPTEFRLLSFFAKNLGHLLPYTQILNRVWGLRYDNPVIVKIYAKYLRDKIEQDPQNPRYILNRRGFGYLMPDLNNPEIDFDPRRL